MNTLVMKFGGSAVGMTIGLTQVLSIVLTEHERWSRLILVVSALDGVTDQLLEATHLAKMGNRRGYRRIVANIRQRHLALIEHLPLGVNERSALQADIDQMLFDMLAACQFMSEHPEYVEPDKDTIYPVIAVGERLAARIVAALLRQNQVRSVALDATDLIITDEIFGSATPDMTLTRQRIEQNLIPMLDRKIIPVITGYIASTPSGKTTVLGRGGSDYSASIVSVCVGADEMWIWTDVDGMMTADPHEISAAQTIPALSYDDVADLAYFGARILHARMIDPLYEHLIPLRVRNVFKPQQPGTLIQKRDPNLSIGLKAVTSIQGLGLAAQYSGSLASVAALVDQTLLAMTGSHADVMISSQSSSHSFVCFVVPTSAGQDAPHNLQFAVEAELSESFGDSIWSVRAVSIITVIGTQVDVHHQYTAQILSSLGDIRLLALSHGPTGNTLSLVTETEYAQDALARIHEVILNQT